MGYKSDIEIAQECVMEPITKDCRKRQGLTTKYLEQYGRYKAKIDYNLLKESDAPDGKLVLVTAINPYSRRRGKDHHHRGSGRRYAENRQECYGCPS